MDDLKELISTLRANTLSNNTLWDVGDLAVFMRLSKSSVQSRYINQKSFPRAFILESSTGSRTRRWKPKDVIAWSERQREKIN